MHTIRSVPNLTHNVINKNWQISTTIWTSKKIAEFQKIPALFQLHHINKYFQIINS